MKKLVTNMQFWEIILGTVAFACALGVCIDLVTANVAVDYFAVHHPKIISTNNSWALALFWGIAASWWAGAIAGVILAGINYRRATPLQIKRIFMWTAIACLSIWVVMLAIVFGVIAFAGTIPEDIRRPTFEYDRRLVAVAMAHQYEYAFGAVATIVIAILTWRVKE